MTYYDDDSCLSFVQSDYKGKEQIEEWHKARFRRRSSDRTSGKTHGGGKHRHLVRSSHVQTAEGLETQYSPGTVTTRFEGSKIKDLKFGMRTEMSTATAHPLIRSATRLTSTQIRRAGFPARLHHRAASIRSHAAVSGAHRSGSFNTTSTYHVVNRHRLLALRATGQEQAARDELYRWFEEKGLAVKSTIPRPSRPIFQKNTASRWNTRASASSWTELIFRASTCFAERLQVIQDPEPAAASQESSRHA